MLRRSKNREKGRTENLDLAGKRFLKAAKHSFHDGSQSLAKALSIRLGKAG
jgi:hypothetical protein